MLAEIEKQPNTSRLRIYDPSDGWKNYDDKVGEDGKVELRGSKEKFDSIMLNALNATNVVVLAGSGTSLCATNEKGDNAPRMADLWDAVIKQITADTFDKTIAKVVPGIAEISKTKNIEKLLSQCKMFVELNEGDESDSIKAVRHFVAEAQKAILNRADFVNENTNLSFHADFIRKLAKRGVRKPRVKIFTTNYDLCFERGAQALGFTTIDGFSHSLPQKYDRSNFLHDLVRREPGKEAPEYIDGVFQMYKLHGSIDWRRTPDGIFRMREGGEPVLIYPRNSKYQESFESPYLEMMGAFQSVLREPDTTLIVSGFGFNDDHIGQPILSALETNMSLRLVLCDLGFLAEEAADHAIKKGCSGDTTNSTIKKICLIAERDPRKITLINGRFENFSTALPDIVAETERERFADRTRLLREHDAKNLVQS